MFRLSLSVLIFSLTGLPAVAAEPPTELAKLSDRALIDEYQSTMRAQLNSGRAPAAKPAFALNQVRAEVVRRGRPIVPDVLALLRTEALTDRPENVLSGFNNPFRDITEALAAIGDPRAVPDLMEYLDGKERHVNSLFRRNALRCIEQITFCAMRHIDPEENTVRLAVSHPTAIQDSRFNDLGLAARLYRTWLAAEGKDPAQWLPLARQRALKLLDGDDPDAIYSSAEFLFSHGGDRRQLIGPLAKVTGELKPGSKPNSWTYRGQPSTMWIASWVRQMTRLGPLARPHAALLIRIQKEHGENAWGYYMFLREVSGDEIIDHFVEVLPRISAEVAKLEADPKTPKYFPSDDPRLAWFSSRREVRHAIDRWAGRQFPTDAERVAWWKANRGHSREQWLAENLDVVVKQVDGNDSWAMLVAREVLPDLPRWFPDRASGIKTPVAWLAEHRSKLKYDQTTEAFRLKPPSD